MTIHTPLHHSRIWCGPIARYIACRLIYRSCVDDGYAATLLVTQATVYDAMGEKERAAAMQSLVKQMKLSWEKKQRGKQR